MANLATAKKGEVITMKSGKRIISDGKGGGKAERKPGKKPKPAPKVKAGKNTPDKKKPKVKPMGGDSTVGRGLRAVANQGSTLTDLVKQTKGK